MALETITVDQSINIKDLAAVEPIRRERIGFSVERDINEEDWQGILTHFPKQNIDEMLMIANDIKFLDAHKVPNEIDNTLWETAKLHIENYYRRYNLWFTNSFPDFAAQLKMLYPERLSELNLTEREWIGMKKELDGYGNEDSLKDFAQQAVNMLILYPEKRDEMGIDKVQERLLAEIQQRKETRNIFAVTLAAKHRILFPETSGVLPTKDDWILYHELLQADRINPRRSMFRKIAVSMKILAADHVEITDKGLELVMPKAKVETHQRLPELPSVRKF